MGVDASPASRLSDRVTAARDGDPQPSASRRLLAFFLVFTSALLGAYMAFRPLNMAMPNADDWQTVLGEAASLGFIVGDDIVFTGGPLSSLYTGYADEHLFWLKLGLRFLLMITLAWSIVSIATANRRPVAGVLFGLGLAVCSFPNDMLLMSLPLLTALIAISKVDQPLDLPVFYLGILSTAAVTLAKFTAAPFAVVAFLLVDLLRLSYRRFPVYLVTYAAATFLLFSVVARSTSFLSYLTGSFSVAAGYTEAMFSNGWPLEFGSFLALAAVLIGAILYSEWRAFRAGVLPLPVALARVAVLLAYIFIAWKEGFVRHDSHSLTGWTGLGIGALTYATIAPHAGEEGWRGSRCVVVLGVILGYCALFLIVPGFLAHYMGWDVATLAERYAKVVPWRIAETKEFFSNPLAWRARVHKSKLEAFASVRQRRQLPRLIGTVDSIPSIQTNIIANGLHYQPRPSFQEYGTYTATLIELNRRSIVEHGPDYLLFKTSPIDGRHPATTEGALWPEIIRHYAPYSQTSDLLVLKRRPLALFGSVLGPEIGFGTTFGRDIRLPDTPNPQFMTATIRKTRLGYLADLLWHPTLVEMKVTYADGHVQVYRVVPAIAEAGFLISPLVTTTGDFLALVTGQPEDLARKVSGLRFQTSPLGTWLYRPEIDLTFRAIGSQYLKDRPL